MNYSRPGRRERRRAETRDLLLRTALRLFAERGFASTTVEDITEAADVGKGTFFNYFPSKEHVMAALGELQLGKLQRALVESADEPFDRVMLRVTCALAEEPSRTPQLARSLLASFMTSEEVRGMIQQRLSTGFRMLADAVGARQRSGEVRADVPAAQVVQQIIRAHFGTLLMWAMIPEGTVAEALERSMSMAWQGLAAKGGQQGARRPGRSARRPGRQER